MSLLNPQVKLLFSFQVDEATELKEGFSGMYIDFHQEVEVRSSQVQITMKTMLTRIGGIIGVGKNLLWTLIFSATSVGALITFIKRKRKFEDNQT